MMNYTVTLNPALDFVAFPERFEKGENNRYAKYHCAPGGKGVNVSLLLSSLGADTVSLGLAAGFTGREIARLSEEAGCKTDFLFLPEGYSRINFFVHDGGGAETNLNGEGPQIPESALDALGDRLAALPREGGASLVFSGSIPGSLPRDAYARLLRRVEGKGFLTVVDATGESLLASLPCRPFLVKPNLEELEGLTGERIGSLEGLVSQARALQEQGARNVAVSLGDRGAFLLWEDGRKWFCPTVRGKAVSTLGAGDSLVAGFLYGWAQSGKPEEALRWGVAAGAATAFSQDIAKGEQVREAYRGTQAPKALSKT